MSNNLFRLAVGAVCYNDGNVALLLRHPDAEVLPSIWEIPSGGVEIGEHILDALIREVMEETGLHIKIGDCVGYFIYESKGGMPCVQVNHLCTLDGCSPQSLRPSDEHISAEWVPLEHIYKYNVSKEVQNLIILSEKLVRFYV